MTDERISKQAVPGGNLYRHPGLSPVHISTEGPFGGRLTLLADDVMKTVNRIVATYSDAAAPEQAAIALAPSTNVARGLLRDMRTATTQEAARLDNLSQPMIRVGDESWSLKFADEIAALPTPERVSRIMGLRSLRETSAVAHHGINRFGLPVEAVEAFQRRHQALHAVELGGLRANVGQRPTLANPLASAVDEDAAIAAGDAEVEIGRQALAALDRDAQALVGVIAIIAAASNRRAPDLFAEVADGV